MKIAMINGRKLIAAAASLAAALACGPAMSRSAPSPLPAAVVFAPGTISGPASETDAAFSKDGKAVVFARNGMIMVSTLLGANWSAPRIAPFSGEWNDQQPTMAPDGSYLVFVSNRPVNAGDAKRPSGNLWRVNRDGEGWGTPVHLPPAVNRGNSTWAPSIAADGSLYFIERTSASAPFRIWRSQFRQGQYEAATPLSFGDPATQDVDPAVAPDESFIVFGSMHPGRDHERLFIAFKDGGAWSAPVDLGPAVNADGATDTNEARLGPDFRTLYFSTDRVTPVAYPRTRAQAEADHARIQAWDNGNQNIWSISLAPWLDARKRQ